MTETVEFWAEALDRRSQSPDQIRLREFIVRVSGLSAGDTAVEIGCGPGALLCDLARRVGPAGEAIGIEPQAKFASLAREKLARQGPEAAHWVLESSAEEVPLASASAELCVAQTVLIHLPEEQAAAALAEMARIVKPGGHVISVDHDADTWTIDHPARELTRRIILFNSDQRFADGWRGRHLRRLFLQAGLVDVQVHPWVQTDHEHGSYLFGLAERIAGVAAAAGFISAQEHAAWTADLRAQAEAGRFFSTLNFNLCIGTKP